MRMMLSISSLVFLLLASCSSSEPGGLYVEARWQVRSDEMNGPPYMPRSLESYSGEDGVTLSCTAQYFNENDVTLSFSIRHANYYLSVPQATFPKSGGAARNSACSVEVQEDNVYVGTCGGASPSAEQPCQLVADQFGTDPGTGSTLIQLSLRCEHLRGEVVPDRIRELVLPGNITMPAQIYLYDCPGFRP